MERKIEPDNKKMPIAAVFVRRTMSTPYPRNQVIVVVSPDFLWPRLGGDSSDRRPKG